MPCLSSEIRPELYAYAVTVLKNLECPAIQIGGTENHVHILCTLSKNMSVAKLVEEIKKSTSRWLKSKGDRFREFYWQNGYGAFSVSQSDVKRVREYILNQEEHHRRVTFQEDANFWNGMRLNSMRSISGIEILERPYRAFDGGVLYAQGVALGWIRTPLRGL